MDPARIPDGMDLPGVYAVARSEKDLSGRPFSLCSEIIYFGMTNCIGGLKSRLHRFDQTIRGKRRHGRAMRVLFRHPDYKILAPQLFVSVCPFLCDVTSDAPENLRIKGDVARFEYECFALFVERFGRLPEFNYKKRSPKKLQCKGKA